MAITLLYVHMSYNAAEGGINAVNNTTITYPRKHILRQNYAVHV